ncbi:MAG: amidohydrolase family protein [Phycisphaerales bacterium]|nr:amidohydrolase family protein [Phycisphaerales bacterium]
MDLVSSSTPPFTRPKHPITEAHGHLPWLGKALSMLSLEGCSSVGEAIERIAARADAMRASPPGAWLQAHSARYEGWAERRWMTLEELDRVTGSRPTLIMSFDHHAVFANSAALAAAKISRSTPDPVGGVIERLSSGPRAGEPSGLLLESAAFGTWAAAPEPEDSVRDEQVASALHHLASMGFVEMHDLASPLWLGPLLARLEREGRLPLRVGLYSLVEEIEAAAASRVTWESARVRLLGGKIFTDGTLNSRTAWVLEPYAESPPDLRHGKPLMTPRQIADAAERCLRLNLGLAMHAIGDGAVRACLDGISEIAPSLRRSVAQSVPLRIEHAELIDAADVPRFAELGVVASVQPCHLLVDIEALHRAVPGRLDRVMPWKSLIESGLVPGKTLLFGSDVPIVRADPEDSIQAAVLRRRVGSGERESINPREAIDEETAWRCFGAGLV